MLYAALCSIVSNPVSGASAISHYLYYLYSYVEIGVEIGVDGKNGVRIMRPD